MIRSLLIAALLVFGMSACGEKSAPPPPPPPAKAPEVTPAPPSPPAAPATKVTPVPPPPPAAPATKVTPVPPPPPATPPQAGLHYQLISPPQPTDSGKKVEVLEFFWYGCPHCAHLQPTLRTWLKKKPADVDFRRAPAVLGDSWIPLTWAYHTLDVMGLVEKLHDEVFAAIHEQRIRLSDQNVLFDWVAKQGVDRKQFIDTYNSFGVKSRGMRSIEMSRDYDISSTPTLVVDGRYMLAPSMFLKPDKNIDYERFSNVLDQVIAIARKERAGK